jgi:Regulator of chromosome condensation (RCC1) repeat
MTASRATQRCRAIAIAAFLSAALFVAPGSAALVSAGSTTTPVLAVDAGDAICVIRTDATIGCWGPNELGEATPPAGTFTAVSAGHEHTCGIRTDGTLACWGQPESGIGVTPPAGTFTVVSAGGDSCAIRTDETIECWGDDEFTVASPLPGTFSALSVGDSSVGSGCAIRTDNALLCWAGTTVTQVQGTFTAVSEGANHTCAIRTDKTITCWGETDDGQTEAPQGMFAAVAAGYLHSCAIGTDGTVACWGANPIGPATPPAGTFTAITANYASCAIATSGKLACWPDSWMPRPAVELRAPSWPTTTAFVLRWSGQAAVAPVTSFDVRYRRASTTGGFGAWGRWRTATTQTSGTFSASPGYTYCFAAQAHDADGGVSGWAANQYSFETCSAVPLDDRSLTRVGSWTALTDASLYRSTGLRSYTPGARLTRTGVSADAIRLVATTCPLCGKVSLYWNSRLIRTISLYSARRVDRVAFRVKDFDSLQRGTLTIKVVSSGKKVIIDGVAIYRAPPFP